MRRRGRACQMVDFIHFDHERVNNVVSDQFKMRVSDPMLDVSLASREEVVDDLENEDGRDGTGILDES